ncbi:MAG: complex I subunit 1/NuoH family protein [Myxococcota bacterium]
MDPVFVVATVAKLLLMLAVAVGAFAPVLVWAERRQSAMMQDRIGPTRAGFRLFGKEIRLAGLLHPLADALKFIWKEDFVPPRADKLLHALAPIIALIPAIGALAIIPFGDALFLEYWNEVLPRDGAIRGHVVDLQIASVNVGILYIFAIAGTGIIGAAIAGYASDNKYSLLGGLRAASQLVSYEVALGLTLVPMFMVFDTLRLEQMVRWQYEHHLWGIFLNPLGFILFLTASIAESKRIPFDVPEGESEIVAGYFTEYSGMKFGMFFMGEFIEVTVLAMLVTTIFLGGWDVPFLYRSGFGLPGGATFLELPHLAVVVIQFLAFLVKTVLVVFLQLQIRWTLPRFRYDQIMKLCWKGMLPGSLILILLYGAGILVWNQLFG